MGKVKNAGQARSANLSRGQQEETAPNPREPVRRNRKGGRVSTPPREHANEITTFERCRIYQTPLGILIEEVSG